MGKASINKATTYIGGFSGKGPYMYSEASGAKCTSKAHGALMKGSGKMSSAHGTNGQSKSNNMNQNSGNAIGKNCRTFKSGLLGKAGYDGGGTAHANQSQGHKGLSSKGSFGK